MFAADFLSGPIWQQLTWTLVHFVWQATAIAGLLLIVERIWGVRRPESRYALSLVALLGLCGSPLVTFAWTRGDDRPTATNQAVAETVMQAAFVPVAETGEASDFYRATSDRFSWPSSSISQGVRIAQPYLLAAYLLGVGLLACRLTAGCMSIQILKRDRLPLPRSLAARAAVLGSRLRVRAGDRIFVSPRVRQAMTIGVWRQLVLLPTAWLAQMPPEMLEAVIAHELAHIRRRDLAAILLERVAETLLFYHPVVWWLTRRMSALRELCCDELAVRATGQPVLYVSALEQAARASVAASHPVLAAAIGGSRKMNLLKRVRHVLGTGADQEPTRCWPVGLLLLLAPLGLLAVSAGWLPSDQATVRADDEREGEVRKDGERREGERKPGDGERKPGDRPLIREGDRPPPREGERKPGEGERKPGDRPPPPREGERKPGDGERKPGDRPPPPREGERKPGDRPPPPRDGERPPFRDGDEQLIRMIMQLREEVQRLREEVRILRGGRDGEAPPRRFDGPRPEGGRPDAPPPRREGDRPRPEERPREGDRPRDGDR